MNECQCVVCSGNIRFDEDFCEYCGKFEGDCSCVICDRCWKREGDDCECEAELEESDDVVGV